MIRLSKSVIGNDEIEAVKKVLQKEFLGMGEEVLLFEKELSDFIGRPVVCVNSGTAAIQLSLQAIGIQNDDEVLVQSLTYVATFQAISATGAKPIACEVARNTLTIDLKDAESRLTERTKAIVPVHYSGSPGQLNEIYSFANLNGLRVIEDAAHAFGGYYKSKLIGSFGDVTCFSFDGIKNITSGEGGAIVSDDNAIIEKVKDLRLLGVKKDSEKRYQNKRSWDFDVSAQGWRYHMSNIMAAIGRAQLSRFDKLKSIRQKNAKLYQELLRETDGLELYNINYEQVVPHIFVVRIKTGKRDKIKYDLENNGIQVGLHYKPNHLLTYFKQRSLPVTEEIFSEILTLPLHPDLKENDIAYICTTLKELLFDLAH